MKIFRYLANKLYKQLNEKNIGTILDDRENLTIGAKIKDCKVLGTPYLVVIGDKQEGDIVELENMETGETKSIRGETEVISTNELIKKFVK